MTTTIRSLVTGLLLGAFAVNSMSAVIDYEPGVSVKFGPSSTVAGINVGSIAGDPSSPVNGDLWYDSTANELTARINGANVALGAGGSSTLTSTYVGYGSGANAVTGEAAFAYDSTFNILSVDAIKLFATGVGISAASSGVLKLEGLGSGFDEAINMDFDTTSNVVQTSSPATGVTIMDYLDMSLRVTDGGGNFATLGPSGITVHNSAWAGNYTLDFGGKDGANEEIASKEWVAAQGYGTGSVATDAIWNAKGDLAVGTGANTASVLTAGTNGYVLTADSAEATGLKWAAAGSGSFDATAVDAVTWSDGANASNIWTFNVSGTDPTLTAGSNNFVFGSGSIDLGSAGVRLSQDGDGALTFLGLGNGSDEDLTLNFDDTSNSIVASSSTGAGLDLSGLAAVNIGTLQGTEGSHLHVIYSSVGSGTAYTMTAAYAAVDMGTTDPSVTIAATGTYRIYANIQVNFAGATYAAFDQAAFKLRRTNNTAADLTDGERGCSLPIMTTTTMLGPSVTIGPIEYTTTNTDDVIVIQGDLNATPSAGTITVTKATIFAERVRQ